MSVIKSVFGKIGTGFLYGAGFAAAIAVTFSVMTSKFERKSETSIVESDSGLYREYDENAKLSTSVRTETINENEFTLIGELVNSGEYKWSSISLRAEIFNKDGQFIDECSEYITQTVSPGEKANFKLSCGSCSKFSLNGYSSYKLTITDAMYTK